MDFMRRHRNKLLLLGGAAGVAMIVKKVVASQREQWENSTSKGFVYDERKKQIHFENLINQSNELCQRITRTATNHLQTLLDDTQLINDLNSKRQDMSTQEKVELWKSLKVKILTKLLSEIYYTCILVCSMRVQMSVTGGIVFAKTVNNQSNVADPTPMRICTKYTALLGSFYDQKPFYDSVTQPIEAAVEEALREYSIDYKICIQDFKAILEKIKRSISFFLSGPNSDTRRFFPDAEKLTTLDMASVFPESGPLSENDEKMIRNMLAETKDILESDDFKQVLDASIEVGYAILLDSLLGAFIKMESKLNGKNFPNPNNIQVPLVKILPQIRNNHLKRTETERKGLVNHLLCLDVLNCFAANVYEAFCNH